MSVAWHYMGELSHAVAPSPQVTHTACGMPCLRSDHAKLPGPLPAWTSNLQTVTCADCRLTPRFMAAWTAWHAAQVICALERMP